MYKRQDSYVGVPLWLNEGLAEYGNVEQDSGYDRYLEWAVATNRLFPFSSLNRFPGNPNLTLVAYGQSKSFIEFLVKKYPKENMKNLMKEISNRKSINESFISSYGKNLNDLEDEWKSTLLSIDGSGSLLKQVDETENILNENGSCSGGKMSFETMLISLLLLTIFVKKLRINT